MIAGRGPNQGEFQFYDKLFIYSLVRDEDTIRLGPFFTKSGSYQAGVVDFNQSIRTVSATTRLQLTV
jgi:hypothetical protein